jgi:uncharacterized protein YbjT (DUF2867 family)
MKKIIVLGGTGYIANRIVPLLLEKGYEVKVSYRNKNNLTSSWIHHPKVELVYADTFDVDSLKLAFQNCSVIYYLVHSMEGNRKTTLESAELTSAKNTVEAAISNNIERLVFLGGLGDRNDKLSTHLSSRNKVGDFFQNSEVPTTILRAGIILGSSSPAFEITRRLVALLPFMVTPKWVKTKTQPISIQNALHYLVECITIPEMINKSYDIGGSDILTYRDMMDTFAEYLHLNRRIISVPFFTPSLSSYWIRFVTGLPSFLARPLTNGMKNEVICKDNTITKLIPQKLHGYKEAIQLALDEWKYELTYDILNKKSKKVEWTLKGDKDWTRGVFLKDHRYSIIETTPEGIWKIITQMGGKRGYFGTSWLWQIRGIFDKFLGGKTLNTPPKEWKRGTKFDFFTIARVRKNKEILLWADIKLSGYATFNYRIQPLGKNRVILHQVIRYYPQSSLGYLYWFAIYAPHAFVLTKMLNTIAKVSKAKVIKKSTKI